MRRNLFYQFSLCALIVLSSCSSFKLNEEYQNTVQFLDAYHLDETSSKFAEFGGISGLDQINDSTYLAISDDPSSPRLYQLKITLAQNQFKQVRIHKRVDISTVSKQLRFDLESIRVHNDEIWISSEGSVNSDQPGFIAQLSSRFEVLNVHYLQPIFNVQNSRHNGLFEGLSLKDQRLWIVNELPLQKDGRPPSLINRFSPVRLTAYDSKTKTIEKSFAVSLSRIKKIPLLPFMVNGVTEILQLEDTKFLWLERAYSAGHKSNGNKVYLWLVDTEAATDVSSLKSLSSNKKEIELATKELLFDFSSIKHKLASGFIDNLEGLSFGPQLSDGSRSLIVVSDNNFSSFVPQLNQFILLQLNL